MNVDYSAYEGRGVTGRVETVLSRGERGHRPTDRSPGGPATAGTTPAAATCQYLI